MAPISLKGGSGVVNKESSTGSGDLGVTSNDTSLGCGLCSGDASPVGVSDSLSIVEGVATDGIW